MTNVLMSLERKFMALCATGATRHDEDDDELKSNLSGIDHQAWVVLKVDNAFLLDK